MSVIIIGGTFGIGLELAKKYLGKTNNLIILGRSEEKFVQIKNDLANNSTNIICKRVDVTNTDETQNTLREIITNYSDLDLVVYSSGFYKPNNTFDVDYKIQAFIDIINIEGRAMYEAMQKYPDPKNWQSELEYQRKIKAKYELKWYKKQSWWKKIKKDVKSADKIKFKIVGYMMKRNWLNKFENDPRRIKYKGIDF